MQKGAIILFGYHWWLVGFGALYGAQKQLLWCPIYIVGYALTPCNVADLL
jgi:hypothetical protein